ncbi:hypothetical protein AB0F07_34245 [Streptomyces fructofermentans]|uniref:hypothetical protein n=1 Tax=Streptomyces fructofermentans TaxID=152141 RepID=UPI0033D353B8
MGDTPHNPDRHPGTPPTARTAGRVPPDAVPARRFPDAPVFVVVDPGAPPYAAPWDLELHGPLDAAVLEHHLGELRPGERGRPAWRHRLLRHGPDHHTLRLSAPPGEPDVLVAGRIADRLTEPPPAADRPLAPAQYAALAPDRRPGYEAVLITAGARPDASALREALRTVLAAHPQLCSRLDTSDASAQQPDHPATGGGPPGGPADAAAGIPDALVEREFTDEAGFAAILDRTGRTLDARTGVQVRLLLARDGRPAGPRADRLALLVHEAAVDAASWHTLLGDLSAALGAAAARRPAQLRPVPDPPAGWVAELRELAADFTEAQHWRRVAERRRATHPHPPAVPSAVPPAVPPAGSTAAAASDPAGDPAARPGTVRHTGFVLDRDDTERITHTLAGRLALTTGQLLTGVFALALARWQQCDEVDFDVRSDPRADHRTLHRLVGRLTDPYPVQLTLEEAPDALGRLTATAGALAAAAGRAAAGSGFGACREWSCDASLRRALRELPPARACLSLDTADGPLPGGARPLHGLAPGRPTHRIQVRAHVVRDRLHIGLDWVNERPGDVTDTDAAALRQHVRDLLRELALTPAAPLPPVFSATPQQAALHAGGDARPGTGRHVEQLVWLWHGPLDTGRFAASWQAVFDRETVLRTAFTGSGEPLLTVHENITPEITRRVVHDGDWTPFLERDRLRGFDLCRPAALRLTVLETQRSPCAGPPAPTRIVLTYHRALLDTWSAHLLLRTFYRAYLADGTLPGGERRPDLRDYTAWVAAQDPAARGTWTPPAPPRPPAFDGPPPHTPTAHTPARPATTITGTVAGTATADAPTTTTTAATMVGTGTGMAGAGRARLRLTPDDTARLVQWAGTWGIAESSVLHAVWAVLIHWASGATAAAPVRFAVAVPGRGILFDGAARMPGPLRNPLPMSLDVDPADTVPFLLRQLRDRALDMAACEWAPGPWTRDTRDLRGGTDAGTVVVFEDPPHPLAGLEGELAAHRIHAQFPGTLPARSVFPLALLAHHDSAGGLQLTAVHDRALLGEDTAAALLAHGVRLLRELPASAGESTTVRQILDLLPPTPPPAMTRALGAGRRSGLLTLRGARQEGAGTICLIPPPGAPASCYDHVARLYPGPQELLVLVPGPGPGPVRPALCGLGPGHLLLGGFSGAGALACDLARHIAADGDRPPRVVLARAAADPGRRAHDLARALHTATGPTA